MSAYIVVSATVNDEDRFQKEYIPQTIETISRYEGRVLVAEDNPEVAEGRFPGSRVVIVEFPDREKLDNWYSSDEYKPLMKIRKDIASSNVLFANAFSQ